MKYQLTVNETQAKVLIDACDLLARIGMGQLEAVMNHLHAVPKRDTGFSTNALSPLGMILAFLNKAKKELGHSPQASYSIGNPDTPDHSKIAYDLLAVLKQAEARAENRPAYNVWHRDPIQLGSMPLATVTVIGDDTWCS